MSHLIDVVVFGGAWAVIFWAIWKYVEPALIEVERDDDDG